MNEAANSRRPELIFALVGPAGTRLTALSEALKSSLSRFGYKSEDIHLSRLLENYTEWAPQSDTSEYGRIRHLQTMGDGFRAALKDGAALGRAAIAAIRQKRLESTGNAAVPADSRAYILRQLKNPAEVDLLRDVYGSSFYLVAGHAPRASRIRELSRQMAAKEDQPGREAEFEGKAIEVIDVDQEQGGELGQNTRATYPRADYFANLAPPSIESDVHRFLDLLFGHPFHTPSPEEYAMYSASTVSLRSSDSSRQVGAVIVSLTLHAATNIVINADIIASGMNEVPRGGGGFYWDRDSPDSRDQWLQRYKREDRATAIKISALTELVEKIRKKEWLSDSVKGTKMNDLARSLLSDLKGSQFMNIGEFGRQVHAEMAALIDAARRGVAVNGHTMYVTTFPCHNCAKHVVAAGIRRVIYLEPYPKSRADFLHGEELVLESEDDKDDPSKVVFRSFTGIAPRQYRQLFSMSERGSKKGLVLADWEAARLSLVPRYVVRNASDAYLTAEREELGKLSPAIYRWDQRLADNLRPAGTSPEAAPP